MLRCTLLLYFGEQTSCYVSHFCCASVNTLPVTLRTSVVLWWTNFMLRCTLLLYFMWPHLHFTLRHFCCTSVHKLHVTLRTSVGLRWTHFMLCCTLLLYFGEHAWCYVAHFCCTSVNTLHVTLHTSVVLRVTKLHVTLCTLCVCEPLRRPIYQRLCAVSSEAAQRCLPILVQ